jgi:mono/diheme cytochrome c family protein
VARALALLFAALALVAAGCGGDGDDAEDGAPEATETAPAGTAEAGESVYASAGCGTCHTLQAAGSSGTTGPNLDEAVAGETAEQIRESIVDPDAEITEGFSAGVMPQDFGDRLSEQELDNLVGFLEQSAG